MRTLDSHGSGDRPAPGTVALTARRRRPGNPALARWGWTAAALAVAALALWIKATDIGYTPLEVALDGIAGLALIGTGAWALGQARDRRLGFVFLLAGATRFAEDLVIIHDGPIGLIGDILSTASVVPLAYLALTFPGSALPDRPSRVAMVLVSVAALVLAPIKQLTYSVANLDGAVRRTCTDVCFGKLVVSEQAWQAVGTAMSVVGVAGGALVLALLVRRYARASRPLRRSIGPFMWSALALTAVTILDLLLRLLISDGSREGIVETENVLTAAVALGFPLGLLQVRMRRAAAASMVMELAALEPGQSPRDILVRALGDPDIELVLFEGGGPIAVEAPPHRVATPLVADGRTFGVLVHDPALEDAAELVPAAAAALALHLDHERLSSAHVQLAAELQSSLARIVVASDAARRQVERDLHDGAQQRLVVLGLKLSMARLHVEQVPAAAAAIDELRADLERALSELRDLARGIYPAILENDGLPGAVREAAGRCAVPSTVTCGDIGRHAAEIEAAIYFCTLEALQNAEKHARDVTHVHVAIANDGTALTFQISDDGAGFDAGSAARGAGLQNMTDRIGALGGRLSIDSTPGGGTRIVGTLPATPVRRDGGEGPTGGSSAVRSPADT